MNGHVKVFKALGEALSQVAIGQNICFKPKQIQCFEFLMEGHDVVSILPTGYGKSLIFQLLPWILPQKSPGKGNIVIVVCPLTSIISDQINVLKNLGVKAVTLPTSWNEEFDESVPDLFPCTNNTEQSKPESELLNPSFTLLFGHPEALLSEKCRKLLKSEPYQERVTACAVDEVHCVEMCSDLGAIKALIPNIRFLAVTATCTLEGVQKLQKVLCMNNLKTVFTSPNRKNIFLDVKFRKPTVHGFKGVQEILQPIALKLLELGTEYPMTVIYLDLNLSKEAYKLFENIMKEKQYVDPKKLVPEGRLFNLFHSHSTNQMKKTILNEIKTSSSRIRVLFATTALGMGVDARDIIHVIHIGPPSTMEEYVQEFGRAGRSKQDAWATLYYNNSDIAANRHVNETMRDYCLSRSCLRKFVINFFGHRHLPQNRCCSICDTSEQFSNGYAPKLFRKLKDTVNIIEASKEIDSILKKWQENISMDTLFSVSKVITGDDVISQIDKIITIEDLLLKMDISGRAAQSEIFCIIEEISSTTY
ncbi:ATP-dependent DNA helicase Q1-like [Clytia hemisphaerica]|uniref:ATP-dependent DNA helicase Q1-like n=1 Tax=Clytia hemisphaerica TaxID=252671 RepID=UPI0034D6CA00